MVERLRALVEHVKAVPCVRIREHARDRCFVHKADMPAERCAWVLDAEAVLAGDVAAIQ